MSGAGRFGDLVPRTLSGLGLGLLGTAAVWAGGGWFRAFAALAVAGMVWELARMVDPGGSRVRRLPRRVGFGLLAGGTVAASGVLAAGWLLPLALLPSFLGFAAMPRYRALFGLAAALVVLAGFGLAHLRDAVGLVWMLWLVLVVIATDVFGYFAGRLIGGRKFWPRVSPKKTWSGTVAGWVVSAAVGAGFVVATGARADLVGISVAVSMAAQMGDIAESAMKRRIGVKDSSNVLPGHGGLMDRFDGMLGASLLLLVVEQTVAFPPGVAA